MEQTPKTSFIPKQAPGMVRKREHRTFNVLSFIAIATLLAMLVVSVLVFLYRNYTATQLEERKAELARLKDSFSAQDIASIKDLERRLNAASALLDGHISLPRVFDALEARTQKNTQITGFTFMRQPSGEAQVTLEGASGSFNTVALQEQQYLSEEAFKTESLIFSDLSVDQKDESGSQTITFSVVADLNTRKVAYTVAEAQDDADSNPATEATPEASSTPEVQGAATSTLIHEVDKEPLSTETP